MERDSPDHIPAVFPTTQNGPPGTISTGLPHPKAKQTTLPSPSTLATQQQKKGEKSPQALRPPPRSSFLTRTRPHPLARPRAAPRRAPSCPPPIMPFGTLLLKMAADSEVGSPVETLSSPPLPLSPFGRAGKWRRGASALLFPLVASLAASFFSFSTAGVRSVRDHGFHHRLRVGEVGASPFPRRPFSPLNLRWHRCGCV